MSFRIIKWRPFFYFYFYKTHNDISQNKIKSNIASYIQVDQHCKHNAPSPNECNQLHFGSHLPNDGITNPNDVITAGTPS